MAVLGLVFCLGLPPLMGALLLRGYRRAENRQPQHWDSGSGLGWSALFALGLLSGVVWMIAWYSWGGGTGNQYPHWQVACSMLCVAASVVGLGCWARWRLSGPLAAAMGTVLGVCLPFGIHGATHDDTGLWLTGLMFLEAGASVGLLLVSTAVAAVHHWRWVKR